MIKSKFKKVQEFLPEISIVICTYNRKDFLKEIIKDLVNQMLDKSWYEIIIVDNGSTDGTLQLVKRLQQKYKKPRLVLLQEKKLGLGFARNCGVKKARGKYVAFLDDDAKTSNNWLVCALDIFKDVKPEPKVVGGSIYPFYLSSKPQWFKDKYETRLWGKRARFLKQGESFSGSNIFFQKRLIEKFGGFDERIGMKGSDLSVGEETSLFEKIWQSKKDGIFYYSPRLIVYHAVPSYKMTVSYQLKRSFVAGQALSIRSNSVQPPIRVIKTIIYFFFLIVFGFFAIIQLVRYRLYQNWLVEKVGPIAYMLGYICNSIGLHIVCRQR